MASSRAMGASRSDCSPLAVGFNPRSTVIEDFASLTQRILRWASQVQFAGYAQGGRMKVFSTARRPPLHTPGHLAVRCIWRSNSVRNACQLLASFSKVIRMLKHWARRSPATGRVAQKMELPVKCPSSSIPFSMAKFASWCMAKLADVAARMHSSTPMHRNATR